MRTLSGMTLRSRLTKMLEKMSTKVVARPIANACARVVVMAMVGQVPSTSTKVGLLRMSPPRTVSLILRLFIRIPSRHMFVPILHGRIDRASDGS